MSDRARKLAVLVGLSVAILVIKAYVPLPILWPGIEGRGLYRVISVVQFVETAAFTFLLIALFAMLYWRLSVLPSALLGVSCALLNFGIMVLDARLQTFPDWIEARILARYGDAGILYPLAALFIGLALGLAYFLLARLERATDHP